MAALQFPASPVIGQIYEFNSETAYEWNGYAWLKQNPENSSIPKGGIIIWSGLETTVPSGWFLCDGNNGTPNLRNRFIVGASPENPIGSVGGAINKTLSLANLPSHSHGSSASLTGNISGTTSEAGAHTHPHNASINAAGHIIRGSTQGTCPLWGAATINSAGSHSHTFLGTISGGSATISPEGGKQEFKTLPPYLTIAYIMKG
jgi:microcystin-dependent protein